MISVFVVGGGRWAKTIVGELVGLLDAPERIVVHSRHNAAGMRAWIAGRRLGPRIDVCENWPDYQTAKPAAVIVVGRAVERATVASSALEAGIAVLVEKPIAVGADAVRNLCDRANASYAVLAASHVFLFARYLDTFASAVTQHGPIRRLELVWQDGHGDQVRGEVKSYDPAVTVFDDVLPHALPMLARLAPQAFSPISVAVENGGAQVAIQARAGEASVVIHLARNAPSRRRLLTAYTEGGRWTLDFTGEPSFIETPNGARHTGDPLWDSAPRPLASMLAAFLAAAGGGVLDPRLSPKIALASAVFADAVRTPYRAQQLAQLEEHSGRHDAGSAYALQELSSEA